MITLALAAAAYLLGSISFAVVASRAFGLADPRTYGSGNPGATNVLRSGNKLAALITLIGDAAKGTLAVWLAQRIAPAVGAGDEAVAWVALTVFLGHLYPIFHGFKGGKGVATAAGVLLGLQPWVGLTVLGIWIAVAVLTRYSSLAALVAALAAPLLFALAGTAPFPVTAAVVTMSALLVWRHAENIRQLLAGTESRIGAKKPPQPGAESS